MDRFLQQVHNKANLLRYGAVTHRTADEIKAEADQAKMVEDTDGLNTFIELFDKALRASDNKGIADTVNEIIGRRKVPKFLSEFEKGLFTVFSTVAPLVPNFSVPFFIAELQKRASSVVALGDNYQSKIKGNENLEFNLNRLGEMIFGEAEAEQKTEDDVKLLEDPSVSCISVKVSNLYSQVNPLGFEHSVKVIKNRLRPRIRAAIANKPPEEAKRKHKLINLDMEEYSDLDITVQVFKEILMEPEFMNYQMGIAIQTYMPDAEKVVDDLLSFAKERVAQGGAPIRIRVVKGANIPMEMVKASENGWKTPTYKEKIDTDANWKKIAKKLLTRENLEFCQVGIATHNDFDLAYAETLMKSLGIKEGVEIEVLEGMANPIRRQVASQLDRKVLVYYPVVQSKNFLTAMAYLVRRFQEQSSESNFLRYAFNVDVNSPEYTELFKRFKASFKNIDTVETNPRNSQNRQDEATVLDVDPLILAIEKFKNDPRTNFALAQNRDWIKQVLDKFTGNINYKFPVRIGADLVDEDRDLAMVCDRFDTKKLIGEVAIPTAEDVSNMAKTAKESPVASAWAKLENEKKFEVFAKAKALINQNRGDLIGLLAAEAGKTVAEAEGEVCELIDFIQVYAIGVTETDEYLNTTVEKESSLVGVIGPFNFPLAIPGGGVVAALLAGNSVILKPSPKTRLISGMLVDILHKAGVPKEVLQVCNCDDNQVSGLVAELEQCIFTGSTEIAKKIRRMNPDMELFAETGGKNAMFVSEFADKELAIKNIVAAYGHNGQKCSATSIVALPSKLYNDKHFMAQLIDAVKSLEVGSPLDPKNKIGPLIGDINARLAAAVCRPDTNGWLVRPSKVDNRDDMITPGLYKGIPRKDAGRLPEYFGPIIDIVCVDGLEDYLSLVKETGSGLTAGIQTLNQVEINKFTEEVEAGVLYVNDKMQGAEAGRNGFGGFANSRFGRGRQAGWFNYPKNFRKYKNNDLTDLVSVEFKVERATNARSLEVWRMVTKIMDCSEISNQDLEVLKFVINNYLDEYDNYFSKEEECPDKVLGKKIIHRFKPLGKVALLVDENTTFSSLVLSIVASYLAGNELDLWWTTQELPFDQTELIFDLAESLKVNLCGSTRPSIMPFERYKMVRVPNAVSAKLLKHKIADSDLNVQVEEGEVIYEPEVEIAKYLQEQSVSTTYHRYGGGLRPEDAKIIEKL